MEDLILQWTIPSCVILILWRMQDLLFSYNIAVDRSDEMKRILGKSAASVGLQLPEVYQPWWSLIIRASPIERLNLVFGQFCLQFTIIICFHVCILGTVGTSSCCCLITWTKRVCWCTLEVADERKICFFTNKIHTVY